MKIVYMGSPEFAVAGLKKLHESHHEIVGVVTTPDRRGGRGRKQIIESAVKKYAVSENLKVLQPKNLKADDFVSELASLEADIFAVVAFRMLPVVVWDMPPMGTINLHGSLLPQYRGAAPIHRAVMDGAKKTGLTTFRLKHKIDTGNILLNKQVSIGTNETTGELHDRMMKIGADLLLETMNHIESETVNEKDQDESLVSHAPKIFHDDCEVNPHLSALEIHNFIRGLDPFPAAWISIDGESMKLFASRLVEDKAQAIGTVLIDEDKLYLQCQDGGVNIHQVQPSGKRKMKAIDYINGNPELPVIIDQGKSKEE